MISKASADTVEGKKGLEDSVFSRLGMGEYKGGGGEGRVGR